MKKYAIALILVLSACSMPIEPATDSDSQYDEAGDLEVEGKEQASICYAFPYMIMGFPENQGLWRGAEAGQIMYAAFRNTCAATFEVQPYLHSDGEINLNRSIGWPISSCFRISNSSIYCNQPFTCPAVANMTIPALWQQEPNAPYNYQVWGWTNPSYASPGNHGIWPVSTRQQSTGAPYLQYSPGPNNTTTLTCRYPMASYNLWKQ